jgi:hypothetical protein
MFPNADLTETTQIYYDIYSVLLPIYTVVKIVRAMIKAVWFWDVIRIFIDSLFFLFPSLQSSTLSS